MYKGVLRDTRRHLRSEVEERKRRKGQTADEIRHGGALCPIMDATVDQLLAATLNHIASLQGQKDPSVGAEALAVDVQPPPGTEQGGQGMASPVTAAAPGMPPEVPAAQPVELPPVQGHRPATAAPS